MSTLFRCLKSDFYKLKHTPILWLHLIIPLIGASLFLWYYSMSSWGVSNEISGYFEVLSLAFPLLIGLMSGMVIEEEEQAGNFQVLFCSIKSKSIMYLSKLITLLLLASFSVVLAVGTFAIGFKSFSALFYIKQIVILIMTNTFLYVLHVFVSFKFGKGASIGLGIGGMLFSALLMTGLGDLIWMYTPWAWSSRFCDYAVLKIIKPSYFKSIAPYLNISFLLMVIVTLFSILLSVLWFKKWEGRKSFD